ncbi:MAG: aminotransferase class III-fold pyridoxal phosphate-dependent enzyme [Desulfobacterales bacterium]|nr:aminotransferase class III-fold pyridoxal phosphate-dependent enzyme [Desulfobacterales bacterium]
MCDGYTVRQKPHIKISPPGPKSLAALEKLKNAVGRGNYMGLYGICIAGSCGVCIEDLDGNIYLDCLTGAASNNLGYNHQIASAYYETAKLIPHTSFSYSPTLYPIELADNLIRITPGTHPKKVLLSLCGSKSCEDALEVIWKYTEKKKIIKFQGAYHGATWLSKTASGFNPACSKELYDSNFLTFPYPFTVQLKDEVLRRLETELSHGNVGGVLIEPVLADAGILLPCAGFFQSLCELLDKCGVLLAVDEIQSGMGRTGKWWAVEHEKIIPDLVIIGKSLASGYAPISALVGNAEVIDSIETGRQIGTFIGHPPSAAAALETIRIIEESDILHHAEKTGNKLFNKLKQLAGEFPGILTEVRGRGLLLGLEIDVSKDKNACKIFATRCVEKGVYFGYYGVKQNVLRIAPPLTVSEQDVDVIVSTIQEVAAETKSGCIPNSTVYKANKFAIGLLMFQ